MTDTGRWYRDAGAERWGVTPETFAAALERSSARAFAARTPTPSELDKYYRSLHLSDLALACACGEGREAAWDHFVTEFRPALYRAADAIDRTGRAREMADALYGELFSRSLFRYFHGRSSLATWLRSLVSQRYVDRLRETQRLDPLPDEAAGGDNRSGLADERVAEDPDRGRFAAAMQAVLTAAVAALEPRERLRLRCYYAGEMTLAQIGRVTRESEATVSRHLARTRKAMREQIEQRLRNEQRFSPEEIRDCISSVMDDSGTLDLGPAFAPTALRRGRLVRKESALDRSKGEDVS
jgi:RNA polymerase sigma factor (sigma-70 family)